jgi:hypothetical protein
MFMYALPDDSAIVLQQGSFTEPQTLLWQNGTIRPLIGPDTQGNSLYYFGGQFSPDGRTLTMASVNSQGFALLNLNQCSFDDCPLVTIPDWPYWSPDSSQMLVDIRQNTENPVQPLGVLRFNRQGERLDGIIGNNPFWLNDQEYGFTLSGDPDTLQYASIASGETGLLLSADALRNALPEEERPDVMKIWRAAPNPADPDILAIQAYADNTVAGSPLYLFLWNRASGTVDSLAVYHNATWINVGWRSGGRWLALPVSELPNNPASSRVSPWDFYYYELGGESQPVIISGSPEITFPRLEPSLDGQWLLMPHYDYLELINLDYQVGSGQPYRRFLPHNAGNCREALFVN